MRIEKAYCINLDRRPEKWEETKQQMSIFGVDVERFSAIDGKILNLNTSPLRKGEIACAFSHLFLLTKVNDEIENNVLIVEDDIVFHDRAKEIFEQCSLLIPADWDIVFLGGNHCCGFTRINEAIAKLHGSFALHGCIYNKKALPIILGHLLRNYTSMNEHNRPIDVVLAELHRTLNVYCFIPHLAYQKEGFSDIQQKNESYQFLK